MTGLYNGREGTFFEWYLVVTNNGTRDKRCGPSGVHASRTLPPIPNFTVFFGGTYNALSSAFMAVFLAPP